MVDFGGSDGRDKQSDFLYFFDDCSDSRGGGCDGDARIDRFMAACAVAAGHGVRREAISLVS